MGKQQRLKEERRQEKIEQGKQEQKKTKNGFFSLFVVVAIGLLGFFGWKALFSAPEIEETNLEASTKDIVADKTEEDKIVVVETNMGAIKISLFTGKAPKTVENFIKLSSQDFYKGIKFHRVIKDFMIQSGDPNSKDDDWGNDGTGGPGYKFEDEFNDAKMTKGKLAMANSGPNTNGSQFFIVTAESAPWLDGKHTVFGEVVEGMDAVAAIENTATNENDHPVEDIVIEKIMIVK